MVNGKLFKKNQAELVAKMKILSPNLLSQGHK